MGRYIEVRGKFPYFIIFVVGLDLKRQEDYEKESNINALHDGYSNYTSVTVDYDCTKDFSQSLTYSYEFYKYKKFKDENNKANSVTYESFYSGKN